VSLTLFYTVYSVDDGVTNDIVSGKTPDTMSYRTVRTTTVGRGNKGCELWRPHNHNPTEAYSQSFRMENLNRQSGDPCLFIYLLLPGIDGFLL